MPWSLHFSLEYLTRSLQVCMTTPFITAAIANSPEVLNGGPGVDHRIPFAIAVRSAYGYYFGSFCVVSRAIIAMTWFGVNCWVGSAAMTEVSNASRSGRRNLNNLKTIAALWPEYRTIKNHLPTSAHITTQQMVSYFLFFLAHLPFFIIPLHKLRYVKLYGGEKVHPLAHIW